MSPALIILVVVVVVIGVVLLAVMTMTRGRRAGLNQQKYREMWLKIENNLDKSNPTTYQFAVLSADKLLDQALRESGIVGKTMGDRLKNATTRLTKIDAVWTAHKLRNRIAHEPDAKIQTMFMKQALSTFKQALKELGAI